MLRVRNRLQCGPCILQDNGRNDCRPVHCKEQLTFVLTSVGIIVVVATISLCSLNVSVIKLSTSVCNFIWTIVSPLRLAAMVLFVAIAIMFIVVSATMVVVVGLLDVTVVSTATYTAIFTVISSTSATTVVTASTAPGKAFVPSNRVSVAYTCTVLLAKGCKIST